MARYIYRRGNAFWCRYPVPGFNPSGYPLEIYTTGSSTDSKRAYSLAEGLLAEIRTAVSKAKKFRIDSGRLIEIIEKPKEAPVYRPTYYELFCRYWLYHLRAKKTAHSIFSDIKPSLIRFGARYFDEIDRADIEQWRQEMERQKYSKAMIRNRIQYIKAIFNYAKKETKAAYRIAYNPAEGLNLKSGDERKFCLTPEKFERNYNYLKNGDEDEGYKGNPDFAFFYLGAWECFRRPEEVAGYRLEYIDWDTRIMNVPGDIAKTENDDAFPFTDRLWAQIAARYQPGDTGLVFRNRNGNPWLYHSSGTKHTLINNTKRHMLRVKEKFGRDAGWFRDTRGGGITDMFRLDVDAKVIMGLSGHHDIRSVMRYNKNFIERMREAISLRGQKRTAPPEQRNVLQFKRKTG